MSARVGRAARNPRPLYDPLPGKFNLMRLLSPRFVLNHFRYRLSDHVVGMLQLAIVTEEITKREADMFVGVFRRGARIRKSRVHEGHAFLAPDGTAMTMFGECYGGSDHVAAGPWNLDNVSEHPGYEAWFQYMLGGDVEEEEDDNDSEEDTDEDMDIDMDGNGNLLPPIPYTNAEISRKLDELEIANQEAITKYEAALSGYRALLGIKGPRESHLSENIWYGDGGAN
ncbi:hypothetical protein F5884DRAFT_208324 [Xylogone sp. PMI_703]|nr:hypothetical protein F5884DRAFT_208324 [Xylogone sp. PMI_703]